MGMPCFLLPGRESSSVIDDTVGTVAERLAVVQRVVGSILLEIVIPGLDVFVYEIT